VTDRDLGPARLLFRGTPWAARAALGFGLVLTATAAAAAALGPSPWRGVAVGGVLLAVTVAVWAALWASATGAEFWATDDALVVHRYGGHWLRVPWSDITGGTWVPPHPRNRTRGGPAVTTAETPFPTVLAAPAFVTTWLDAARVLRDEFTRRGIPWDHDPRPHQVTTDRPPGWTW
jgi:hypothetical protein